MRIVIGSLTVITLLSHAALEAQVASVHRVRVTHTDGSLVVGTLLERSAKGLHVREDGTGMELLFPEDQVRTLEVSLGERREFGKNFFSTVGITTLVGGVVGAVTWTPCRETGLFACFMHPSSRGEAMGFGLLSGGIVGLPLGLIIGLASKSEKWESVAPTVLPPLQVRLAPAGGSTVEIHGSIRLGGG